MTANLKAKVKRELLDHVCPINIKIPRPSLPNMGVLRFFAKIFNFLKGFFTTFQNIFGKDYCITYFTTDWWWEDVCTRLCHPCCSWHGRRRWAGGIRCRTCCHRICVPTLKSRWYSKRACFNALKILKGLGFFFDALLAIPIAVIKALLRPVINKVTEWLNKIVQGILDAIPQPPSFPSFFIGFSLPIPDINFNFNCHGARLSTSERNFVVGLGNR
jgi:hypothetical protein